MSKQSLTKALASAAQHVTPESRANARFLDVLEAANMSLWAHEHPEVDDDE